jgi:hypothetical protein
MEMVTIAKFLYENLLADRVYLEAVESVLEIEISKNEDEINELYEEKIKFYNKVKGDQKNGTTK